MFKAFVVRNYLNWVPEPLELGLPFLKGLYNNYKFLIINFIVAFRGGVLGLIITTEGIKINPKKVIVVTG